MKKLFTALMLCFGCIALTFTAAAQAPSISVEPQSQTNTVGDNVTFTVTASGDAPLAYQWQKDGGDISEATDSSYTISSVVTADAADNPGYTVIITNSSGSITSAVATLTIDKADQTITFGALGGKTYGDVSFGVSATASSGLTVAFSIFSGPATITGDTNVNITGAGVVVVRASQSGDADYNAAPNVDQSFTVTNAVLTVTADDKSKTYGAINPTFTASYSGFVNDEDESVLTGAPSLITAADTNSPVAGSPYTITVGAGTLAAANYSFSFVDGDLTVTAATLTVTADDTNRVYGASNPTFTATFSGFVNDEDESVLSGSPSLTTTADTNSAVAGSPYTITAAVETLVAANYTFSFVDGTLTITKATLTVTADDKSRAYGAADPTFTASYTGFLNEDTESVISGAPAYTTSADTNSPVAGNPYSITPALGTLSAANYNFTTFVDGELTVTNATLTVMADDKSRTYGATNPTLTVSYSGFVNDEDESVLAGAPSLTTAADTNSTVAGSPYMIAVGAGTLAAANYSFSFLQGDITVTEADLTITSDDTNRVYGATNPVFTGSVVGLQNNDDITASYSTSATTNSAVGNYTIAQALNDPDTKLGNYTVTTNDGTLTITAAALTVSVNSTNRGVGQVEPVFTGTISGIENNDDIMATYATTATIASPAGTYDIYPEFVDPDLKLGNYAVTTNLGTLTVDGPPAIDTQPSSLTIGAGSNAVFTVVASGTSLSYQWRKGMDDLSDGGNIVGASSASLTLSGVSQSDAATDYTVYISNSSSSITSAPVSLTVIDPPVITVGPLSRTNFVGTTASFSVTASGTGPLQYRWRFEGVNLPDETLANLNVLNVQESDAGDYTVVITNLAGSVTSAPAVLSVHYTLTATAGVGGTVSKSPDALTYDAGSNVDLTAATSTGFIFTGWSGDGSGTSNPLSVTMTTNKSVTANFMGPGADIIVDNGQATFVGNWTNGYFQPGHYGDDYRMTLPGTIGETARATYRPQIVRAGNYDVYIQYPEKNNRSTNSQWLISYNGGSTLVSVNQKINGSGSWFRIATNKPFVAGTNQFVRVSNDTGPGEGGTNTFIIADAVRFVYSANNGTAPTFVTHPQSQTINQTSNVTFTVAATGTGTLAYQWRFNNEPISGATDSSYTRTNLQAGDAGNYAVVVIHDTGSAISSNAVLSVNLPPTITTQPANKTVIEGQSHTFTVATTGTAPLYYQWRFESVDIPGATASSYLLSVIETNEAGYYSVVVSNMAGVVTSSSALLTVNIDPELPRISIISPANGGKVANAVITVTGTAKDNVGVAQVKYLFNGITNTASGTKNWSALITNTPYANTITAWSIDMTGKESLRDIHTFYYNSTNSLTLNITGSGQVSGVSNGQGLLVGRSYTATAFIGSGTNYVFTNWTGSVTSTNKSLGFIMQSNMVLTANFITNPFTPVAGKYNGLFFESGEVRHESAGFFTLTLSKKASYSGKLLVDGNSVSINGKFDLSGQSSATVSRAKLGKSPLTLSLELDWSTTNETIHGTLTDGNWISDLRGNRVTYDAIFYPTTNFLGRYTLLIPPPTNGPVSAPGGYGYAMVSNNAAGNIRIVRGALGDGAVLSQSVPISKFGEWPLYVHAYKNKTYYTNGPTITTNATEMRGALLGWVTFTNIPSRNLVGTVDWIKTELPPTNTYYAAGFTNRIELIASAYTTPATGTRLLDLTNGLVIHSEGNIVLPLTNNIILKTNNAATINHDFAVAELKFSFDAKIGLLKGSFVNPGNTNKVTSFSGAVLQEQNYGAGHFLGADQSGTVTLEEND